jgi:alkaline phosphatase D
MAFGDNQAKNLVAVGTVDHQSACLWFRAERPGRYVVDVFAAQQAPHGAATVDVAPDNQRDNTATVIYRGVAGSPLLPLHRYTFKVRSEDGTLVVGEGRFETAPANADQTPNHFSIGLVSCHQPFGPDGAVADRNLTLLQGLPALFDRYDIKFLLGLGDQIYADTPSEFSLLSPHYLQQHWPDRGDLGSWTPPQIRQAYQERHRICWGMVPWLKLLSSYPNYSILDDHEVFDDWGSAEVHQTNPWKKIVDAARLAYLDYQGSRQIPWNGMAPAPAVLGYEFTYGSVATFVFDLRSERTVGPPAQVVGPGQITRFKTFLAANKDAHVIMVVTSVPLVHLPEWVTAAGQWVLGTKVDFPDQWSAPQNLSDRNAVLGAIREHLAGAPRQRFVVVGGDVHVGCAFELHFVGGEKSLFYEFTTSAVSNRLKAFEAEASVLGPQAFSLKPRMAGGTLDVSLLRPATGAPGRNPIGGLNAGIIEFHRKDANETNLRFKLIGYDEGHSVKEEFVSGLL